MTHASVNIADRPSWHLRAGVLVYGSEHGGPVYATVHKVEGRGNGRPQLGAGVPATRDACAELARALGEASTLSGFVPPALVYLGARAIAWWRPAGPATVHFDTTKSAAGDQANDKTGAALIGKKSGRTPQPALVFAVTGRRWFVFALAASARPGPGTKLLRAPHFNVWENGEICTGNVKLPSSLSVSALEQYERAFFDSEFTHPNVRGKARLVRGSAYELWASLLAAGDGGREFPVGRLVDAGLTLGELVKQLEKGRRAD